MALATIELVSTIILKLMQAAPTVISTINDIKPFAQRIIDVAKGEKVTPEQEAEVWAMVEALYAKSQEPLPPAQPGDPDYVPPTEPAA